jgi:nucleoside-diphosphate-sugar epimerase
VAAVERGGTGETCLFGGADASYAEFVGIIGELLGRKVPKRPVPAWVLRPAAAAMAATAKVTGREPPATPEGVAIVACDRHIRSDKASRVLGYQPSSLRTMLEDAYGWLTAEGLL